MDIELVVDELMRNGVIRCLRTADLRIDQVEPEVNVKTSQEREMRILSHRRRIGREMVGCAGL